MRTFFRGGLVCLPLAVAGCVGDDFNRDALYNPFRTDRRSEAKGPVASAQAATRVHAVGREVIAANGADFRDKPVFMTVGLTEPMIFHRQSGDVVISEGLVQRCGTDAELAAVLCHELGKVAAEQAERGPPPAETDLPPAPAPGLIGGPDPDMTRRAEEALYDRRRPRANGRAAKPDPQALAKSFLTKTGHTADDLARMEAVLREAEENAEKREFMRGR